jgi:hypothetical protein
MFDVGAIDPEAVVQAQLDAYNAHDLAGFVAAYTEDVQLFEHPSNLLAAGSVQMRERYAERFKDPILHAVIVKRIVMGNVVVDHEKVTATLPEGRRLIEAIAIYEVRDGKIAKAWLIYGPKVLDPK